MGQSSSITKTAKWVGISQSGFDVNDIQQQQQQKILKAYQYMERSQHHPVNCHQPHGCFMRHHPQIAEKAQFSTGKQSLQQREF